MEMETNLATLMDKSVEHVLSDEERTRLMSVSAQLLNMYDYRNEEFALNRIITEWNRQNGWLVELFKKSPYYNGNFQIIIPANLNRPFDKEGISTFIRWAFKEYRKALKVKRVMVGLFTYEDYETATRETERWYDRCPVNGTIKGYGPEYWESEYNRMYDHLEKVKAKYRPRIISVSENCWSCEDSFCIPYDEYEKLNEFETAIKKALSLEELGNNNMLSEEHVTKINGNLTKFSTKALVGQKVTKFVGKLLKEVGINKVVDIQTTTWYDTNGNKHERTKDMGYNYHFALLGDSVSPNTYEREIVISCNPVDYWTMSFGYKWASCHTIDKLNRRGVSSSHYTGCYSGGDTSYMIDNSTFIVYIRPTKEEIKSINEEDLPMEIQSKWKRCLFMLGEDKLIQSRLYPDGRDGGDQGLASQLRGIVQKVIADCLETSNMWTLKKGSREASNMIDDGYGQIHYPDYHSCSDVNVSYLRRINGNLNTKKIKVGVSEIICPSCGSLHDNEENICCRDCADGNYEYYCDCCGNGFDNSDGYHTNDGHHYCSLDCAERNDYYEVEDDNDLYYIGDIHEDAYTNEYYSSEDDEGYYTYEGNWYHTSDNCYSDGNRWCEDIDDWSNRWVEATDGRYYHDESDLIEIDGKYYPTEEDAIDAGYIENEDGEWVAA